MEFALKDLESGCRTGIYEEVSAAAASRAKEKGAIISSAFAVWQDSADGPEERLVVNLAKQSKRCKKGSVKLEALSEFDMNVQRSGFFITMDIEKGYRHMRLHPSMRDWFIFRYAGRYFKCVALPLGWGRSCLWFTQLIFVKELRSYG